VRDSLRVLNAVTYIHRIGVMKIAARTTIPIQKKGPLRFRRLRPRRPGGSSDGVRLPPWLGS
jgi:hypothetical protein